MTPEMRLVSIGWPLEDALTFCFSKRKEGGLEEFVRKEEERYREVCRRAAQEAMD